MSAAHNDSSASTGEMFGHPSPAFERAVQLLMLLITAALVMLILVQLPLMLLGGFPFILAALVIITCLGLIPFTLLPAVASPAMTATAEGLLLMPLFLPHRLLPWAEVTAVKHYPLMPSAGSENTRVLLVGRRKYQPMDGIMLIAPTLPAPYRLHGLIVSEGWVGVIALTNRSHTNYARLVELVQAHVANPG